MPAYESPVSSPGSMRGITPMSDTWDDSAELPVPSAQAVSSVGIDIGNDETRKKLDFIEQLYSLGISRTIDLPQLVVVGDQSSGKSSVLQAVSLHRQSGPETITVTIKRDESESIEQLTDLSEAADLNMGSPDFPERFAALLSKAGEQILTTSERLSSTLGKDTLRIDVRGPNQMNLTIVDIPGLVSVSHTAHGTARALVQRYINNPRSIILAVAHTADPGTQDMFQMLSGIPDREDRVIGVITKCDRKQEGADEWIIDTIRNGTRTRSGDANPHYLRQGWYGLRNRLPAEKCFSDDERDQGEANFFGRGVWLTLNPTNLGIKHLRVALTKMHNNHIARSIPELVPEIKQQLSICDSKVARLGRPRSTTSQQIDCLVKLATDFSRFSENALDGVYHNLPDAQGAKLRKTVKDRLQDFRSDLYADQATSLPAFESRSLLDSTLESTWRSTIWTNPILKRIQDVIEDNRGTELPDEVNPNVMKVLWKGEKNLWSFRGNALLEELTSDINETICILVDAVTHDVELRQNTKRWLSSSLHTVLEAATTELAKLVSDQDIISTISLSFTKYTSNQYEHRVKALAGNLHNLDTNTTIEEYTKKIKMFLSANRDLDMVIRTYVRLNVYYELALKRFLDNVAIQVVERHLLGPKSPLRMFTPSFVIEMADETPELIKTIAGENEEKVTERAAILKDQEKLKAALATARQYGFFSS